MCRHDEREVTLPAGMELVVPPRAPDDIDDEPRPGSGQTGRDERASFAPPTRHGEARRG